MVTGIVTFDKPDSATLGPEQTFTKVLGSGEVFSRAFRSATVADVGTLDSSRVESAVSADMWVKARVFPWTWANVAAAGICLRYADAAETYISGFLLGTGSGAWTFNAEDVIAHAEQLNAMSQAATFAAEAILEMHVVGSTVTAFVNGVAKTGYTSAIASGTKPGVSSYRQVSGDASATDWIQWGTEGESFTDVFVYAERGTVANTTGGTTSTLTLVNPTFIQQNNYLVVVVAVDNAGAAGIAPTLAVTDSRSNTWTVLTPVTKSAGNASNDGTTLYVAYMKRGATAFQAADTLTLTWGTSVTAKAAVCVELGNVHPTNPIAVAPVTATGASTTPSIPINTTGKGQLLLGAVAVESGTADTYTEDADTADGVWKTMTRTGAGVTTAGQTIASAYKVASANVNQAQQWDPVLGTSRQWAALGVVFEPADPNAGLRKQSPILLGGLGKLHPYAGRG